jgi:hypothetical protein
MSVTYIWPAERDSVTRGAVVIHNFRDQAAVVACDERDAKLVLQRF